MAYKKVPVYCEHRWEVDFLGDYVVCSECNIFWLMKYYKQWINSGKTVAEKQPEVQIGYAKL